MSSLFRLFPSGPSGPFHLLALFLAAAWHFPAAAEEVRPPNIVFILADDLGWTDLGVQGSKYYETPHIDRLAAEGARLTNFHACQNCTPTRAALMSGQYAARTGVYTVGDVERFDWRSRPLVPVANEEKLPTRCVTVADTMKRAGYATGMFGKWHIGEGSPHHPADRGFDEAIATMGRHFDFTTRPPAEYPEGTYLADFLTDQAAAFIARHKDEPFFLYLPHFGVHSPYHAKPEWIDHFTGKEPVGGHFDRVYAAMIASVDESVGGVMAALEGAGIADDTVVIFSSDNGGVGGYRREGIGGGEITDNAPLRSGKGSLYEGGIRVPFIARWPGVIPAGSSSDVAAIHVDLYPTFAEIAGAELPADYPLDGQSLLPFLRGDAEPPAKQPIFQHFPGYLGSGSNTWRATPVSLIQDGPWKLMEFLEDGRRELYHLGNDIGETTNLLESEPERAADLHARLVAWRDEVKAPMPERNSDIRRPAAPESGKAGKGNRKGDRAAQPQLEPWRPGDVFQKAPSRLSVSADGSHFVSEDGTPFFYLADTAWELFHRLDRDDADRYLENRARLGFTAIQAVALAEQDGLRTANRYGHLPFVDLDPTRPDVKPGEDDDYWDHVDYCIDKATSLGLVTVLLPTWGDKWNLAWGVGPEIFTPENAEVYGEWLGRRYAGQPVIWMLGGDRPVAKETHRVVIEAMARGIARGDGGRGLMTFHPKGGDNSADLFHEAEWLDFNTVQSGHKRPDTPNYVFALANRSLAPAKPTLDAEPCYEDHPVKGETWERRAEPGQLLPWFDEWDIRVAAYQSVLSGACGHTYGDHNLWQFWKPGIGGASEVRTHWKDALQHPGARQMGYLRSLLESRQFWKLRPAQELIVSDNPEGVGHVRGAMAAGGGFALLYLPTGQPVEIDFTRFHTKGQIRAAWFNPRQNSCQPIATFPLGENQLFAPPSAGRNNDWVLLLDATDRKLPRVGFSHASE